ncbi:MAG: FomA family porin-like outer membrane protein [Cetobacterium sp.]
MKKISLLLGALLAVSITAKAKEVAVIPEIKEEIVEVVIVEKPTIIESFRPTGFVGLEYRAYGNTEGHGDETNSKDTWNRGNNKYSRLQTTFGVSATENFRLEGRVRDYNNLERDDSTRTANAKEGTDTRLRAFYKHSDLYTSRFEYRDYTSDTERYQYQLRITPYRNEGGFINAITFAPKYSYTRYTNGTDYKNTFGADLYMTGNLPLGFTWENNVYLDYDMYSKDYVMTGVDNNGRAEYDDKEFVTTWEFYLYNSVPLYIAENHNFAFNFEGGYDPYTFRQYDRYALDKNSGTYTKSGEANYYSLYTAMDISLTYSVTPALTLKTGAGAEYRNWNVTDESKAKDWRWQPYAYAAMNIKF